MEYVLKHPFDFGSQHIDKITLKRLKGKDIRGISKDAKADDMVKLASKSAGLEMAILDEMDAADLIAVLEILGDFLGAGHRTGQQS